MQPWLDTFRESEHPPIADLARRIFRASFNGTQALMSSVRDEDYIGRTERLYLVQFEFLYFFMHMASRVAFGELGHERRCKMQDQLIPLIVQPTIESIFGHSPANMKDKMESEFIEKLNNAELEYATCKQLFDRENLFASNALFSKFAAIVCDLLGLKRKGEDTIYLQTFAKVAELALDLYKELNLPEVIRALDKDS